MRKNQMKKLAASVAAALLSTTMLSACSALSQAPTVVSEESSLHHDTDGSSAAVPGSESSEAAHSDSASGGRLADILERGYIEVATEPYFAPNEFIDPSKQGDGKYVGADIELARYIAEKLGVECRIVPLDFESVLSGISDGKYDLAISALAYTPARAEAMELSKGYYFDDEKVQYGLMVRTENLDKIKSAEDLADKTLVVQSGSLQEMFANEQVPAYKELKRVSAITDGFLMVQEGKADAVITAKTTAELYLDANDGCGMTIVPDFSFTVDESTQGTRIGITKGETELLQKVNEIIDEVVKEGTYASWYEEYKEYARSLGL